jgi:hypothetical protein
VKHITHVTLLAVAMAAASARDLNAQGTASRQPAAAGTSKVAACSLLSRDEVKQYLPWIPALDRMAEEEEPIGINGSSCNYPSATIQVMSFSRKTMDNVKAMPNTQAVSGVGDEAYLRNRDNEYAELFVKIGERFLTVQANLNNNFDALKPGTLGLGRALVAKLR